MSVKSYSFVAVAASGYWTTTPNGINSSGVVAGQVYNGNIRGFIEDKGSFSFLDAPGALYTTATGINDRGMVVGFLLTALASNTALLPTTAPTLS